MKQTKANKTLIKDFIWKAQKQMGIGHYELSIVWETKDNKDDCYATIDTSVPYLSAIITFYPIFWKQDPYQQERTIFHELSHIITEDLYVTAISNSQQGERDWIEGTREQTTEIIARIAHNASKENLKLK